METIALLKSNVLFQGVQQTDMPHLLSCLHPRETSFPKDYTIIEEGETSPELGVVLHGSVSIVRHDFWGNRTLVTRLGVGDIFAETIACTGGKSEVSVITDENCVILFFGIQHIITDCQLGCSYHHAIIENMVKLLAQKNIGLMKKINHITKRSTREKLLSFLSEEAIKEGKKTFTILYDRQQLADYLCVERSAMSNELSKMRNEGLLDYHKSTFTLYEER